MSTLPAVPSAAKPAETVILPEETLDEPVAREISPLFVPVAPVAIAIEPLSSALLLGMPLAIDTSPPWVPAPAWRMRSPPFFAELPASTLIEPEPALVLVPDPILTEPVNARSDVPDTRATSPEEPRTPASGRGSQRHRARNNTVSTTTDVDLATNGVVRLSGVDVCSDLEPPAPLVPTPALMPIMPLPSLAEAPVEMAIVGFFVERPCAGLFVFDFGIYLCADTVHVMRCSIHF